MVQVLQKEKVMLDMSCLLVSELEQSHRNPPRVWKQFRQAVLSCSFEEVR